MAHNTENRSGISFANIFIYIHCTHQHDIFDYQRKIELKQAQMHMKILFLNSLSLKSKSNHIL